MQFSKTTEITKQNLIDAFWIFYQKKSLDKITIKEIVELAGYNRATFYNHFTDVYDLRRYIGKQIIAMQSEYYDKLIRESQNVPRELVPQEYFDMVYVTQKKYLSVLLDKNGDPEFQQEFKRIVDEHTIEMLRFHGLPENDQCEAYLVELYSACAIPTILLWYRLEQEGMSVNAMDIFQYLKNKVILPIVQERVKQINNQSDNVKI